MATDFKSKYAFAFEDSDDEDINPLHIIASNP